MNVALDVGRRWTLNDNVRGLCFLFERPHTRAEISTLVDLQLRGYDVQSVRPFPTSDDGKGHITWLVRGDRSPTLQACVAPASTDLVTAIRTRADFWRLLYPLLDYWPLLLVFLIAAFVVHEARRAGQTEFAATRAVLRAALALTVLLVAMWWVRSAADLVAAHAQRLRTEEAGPWWKAYERALEGANMLGVAGLALCVVVVGALAVRVTGVSQRRLWRAVLPVAAVFAVVAMIAVGVAGADTASNQPVELVSLGRGAAWYHVPLTVAGAGEVVAAFALIAGFAALILITIAAGASSLADRWLLPRRAVAAYAAALVGLLIGGHWLLGEYTMWKNSDYRGPGFAHDLLSFQLFYSAASLMTAVLFALPIALFLSLLAAMRASRASAKTFADAGAWLQYAIALIFSAYVVGRGGWIEQLSLPMPVAFIVAFATLAFLARRTRDEPAPDQTVGAGPGRNWWENGVWAAKLSVPLAAVPFLFYAYILLDARLGPAFALHATPELLTVPVWIVNEAIFWIASALVLGWLLAYLPGRNAVLKGLALAGVYAGSVGLGALLLGRTDQHWLFRAFIVVLFYIGVGIRIDLATLKLAGRGWRDLVDAYRVGTWRGAAAYAAPALLALIGIASQIYAGHPAQAGHDLLQNLTTFIPKPGGGSGT